MIFKCCDSSTNTKAIPNSLIKDIDYFIFDESISLSPTYLDSFVDLSLMELESIHSCIVNSLNLKRKVMIFDDLSFFESELDIIKKRLTKHCYINTGAKNLVYLNPSIKNQINKFFFRQKLSYQELLLEYKQLLTDFNPD